MLTRLSEVLTAIGSLQNRFDVPHKTLTLQAFRRVSASIRTQADWLGSRRGAADVAVFHDFRPPPYGGGNQFLLALVGELERRGLRVESNRLSGGTPACLYNSFNFDFAR